MSKIRLRPLGETDLVERTKYYASQGGRELSERFFDTATELLEAIDEMPGSGSLRIGELSGVPGLRSCKLAEFPCGWFYFERSDCGESDFVSMSFVFSPTPKTSQRSSATPKQAA